MDPTLITPQDISRELRQSIASLTKCEFGISYLDDALIAMFPGDLTLVGARSGAGKTDFGTICLLAQQDPEKQKARSVLYFALDHEFGEIEKRAYWRLIQKQIKLSGRFAGKYFRYAEWVAGHYVDELRDFESDGRIHLDGLLRTSQSKFHYRKGYWTGQGIAQVITSAQSQYGLFIIDHFHALNFPGRDVFQAQSHAIRAISQASQDAQVPVLLLGQFRKRTGTSTKSPIPEMDEFSGHSDLIYLPQNIVTFGPKDTTNPSRIETYFHIAKARAAGDTKRFVGLHGFDLDTRQYTEKYETMDYSPYADPKPLSEHPRWAKRDRRNTPGWSRV